MPDLGTLRSNDSEVLLWGRQIRKDERILRNGRIFPLDTEELLVGLDIGDVGSQVLRPPPPAPPSDDRKGKSVKSALSAVESTVYAVERTVSVVERTCRRLSRRCSPSSEARRP